MPKISPQLVDLLMKYSADPKKDRAGIALDAPVFGPRGVVLDSLAILDALCDIEKTFSITIPDEDLTEELFATVGSLATYIERKLEIDRKTQDCDKEKKG